MRLVILIVIATLVVSCNNSQESQSHIPLDITDKVEIVIIDSCEYVLYHYYKGCGMAHKGNCKFCKRKGN